jgi:predicted ATPase/class 3 adenylate cyclase
MVELPSGTVTFFFTDIEGSTRLLQQLGNRYPQAVAKYRELLRAAVHERGGCEMDATGDAFVAVFSRARDAFAGAIAAQRALITNPWPEGAKVRVRAALHTGEAVMTDVGYVGIDVHRAARICAVTHGGQILLSETTSALVEMELPEGIGIRDLGLHRLKDLARPQHLLQVVGNGLPDDFPALRTLDTLPNNLPRQLTSFIGQEKAAADVKRLLSTTRLLTLTGIGGAGKTRMALQTAADVVDQYPDGVWLAELAPVSAPSLVPKVVASALSLPEQRRRSLTASLLDYLRPRSILLVLDNCEHLLDACAQLSDVLMRGCPHLRILATSRESLGLEGERIYRVPSLSIPDSPRWTTTEDVMRYEAVRLFMERAASSNPGFQLTTENAPAVVHVCQRLDGIPLALELAAARLRVLAVEQLAARLGDRFRLLSGGSRSALPRHKTLRAAMDWSYDLLLPKERVIFHRLSVFAGGWTLEAAETVCSGARIPPHEALELLSGLVDKSLLIMEAEGGEARYRLLESVRQYAQDRLVESGEAADVRRRCRDWFLALAERAEPRLRGRDSRIWLKKLETEHDNLRAALEWSEAQEDGAETMLRLCGALGWFWTVRGFWFEARRWMEAALERSSEVRTPARIKVLQRLAVIVLRQRDYERTTALSEEALSLCAESGDSTGIAVSTDHLGMVALRQHEWTRATVLFERSLALFRELGNKWFVSMELAQLGMVARSQGDYTRAAALQMESLDLFREVGDEYYGIPYALRNVAFVALHLGDCLQAAKHYREAITLSRGFGDPWIIEECLEGLGRVACALGRYERAARLFGVAEASREVLGDGLSTDAKVIHDQGVSAASAGLGVEGLASAWTAGRAMTLEQAIDYALLDVEGAA